MKYYSRLIITLLSMFSSAAFAHEDHLLGDGLLHAIYHVVFWGLCIAVAYKAYKWFAIRKKQKTGQG